MSEAPSNGDMLLARFVNPELLSVSLAAEKNFTPHARKIMGDLRRERK